MCSVMYVSDGARGESSHRMAEMVHLLSEECTSFTKEVHKPIDS